MSAGSPSAAAPRADAPRVDFPAAILAGGKSRRMGQNKSFLSIRGRPAVLLVAESLLEVFSDVYVFANEAAPYREMGFRVLGDLLAGNDSLGGLHAAVASAGAAGAAGEARVFVTGCDMPTLQPALLDGLASLAEGRDVVIPIYRGYPEPLCAVYSAACREPIERSIEGGNLKMIAFHEEVRVLRVEEEVWRAWDPGALSFRNMNTPEDYDEIQAGR